ncbi:GNAT family N-acetyltransferase [Cryobacterium zongtaii]|uniref:GNAT family N-acetyltransferase n=1 Tax=Cryobacterium zongtaii TaxID=1259217 RepID=A0A2S3ZGI6_9MICO|nr:GNAT family N-acetyltransferase [Cryobacterium zongtaii]POH66468.1 GNAT family N-acetyltransferase [Cryobacterium zongtaii]
MTEAAYRFSADTAEMDRDQIHRWLSTEAYWALGRARSVQDAAIDASVNFGMFEVATGRQVAYARLVTDSVTFAWLCDVFVDPTVRGRGVGVSLIEKVGAALDTLNLRRVALATSTAHGLYAKFGFDVVAAPEHWMERRAVAPAAS